MTVSIHRNTKLKEILKLVEDCNCEHCRNGCKFGSGFLADEDLKKLAGFLGISENELKEKYLEEFEKFSTKRFKPKLVRKDLPFGKCIFYEEKTGCKVHPAKPLECRIAMGCKEYGEDLIVWFNLNNFVNVNNPQSIRDWALYLKSGGKNIKGGKLTELVADEKELKEILEYIKLGYEKDWEKELGLKDE